jgi:hypothetical protein
MTCDADAGDEAGRDGVEIPVSPRVFCALIVMCILSL